MSALEPQTNIFDQRPPQGDLFHYTSAEGLKGIVSGRTLWATSIEYLNDTAEFKHGEAVLKKVVANHTRHAKGDSRKFFHTLYDNPAFFQAEDVFVSSLSESDDLLSQWRGYTPSNFGFSVGFDPQILSKALWSAYGVLLVRCLYSDSEQNDFTTSYLNSSLTEWINAKDSKKGLTKFLFNGYSTFVAAAMKHHTFAEEREWRLLGVCRDLTRFRFRPGKSALTPYIELKWGAGTKEPNAQPIRSVTIGPCPTPELAAKSVSRLLKSCGLDHVHVRNSRIPFRSW